jgi:hypothetical protein
MIIRDVMCVKQKFGIKKERSSNPVVPAIFDEDKSNKKLILKRSLL